MLLGDGGGGGVLVIGGVGIVGGGQRGEGWRFETCQREGVEGHCVGDLERAGEVSMEVSKLAD